MSLDQLRQEIDAVDRDMVRLLEQRMALVSQVADYKFKHQLPVLNQVREQELLEKIAGYVVDNSYESSILAIFKDVMKHSKVYQEERLRKLELPSE